jgi:hypothetical protein
VAAGKLVFPVRRLAPDGLEAWKQVVERGYEGYVAKDEGSLRAGSGPGSTVYRPTWVSSAGPDGSPYLATIWSLILS